MVVVLHVVRMTRSSANKIALVGECISFIRSFMVILKSVGERTAPCGTPFITKFWRGGYVPNKKYK